MEDIYAKKFTLPKDFPDLLKDFTREILREQTSLTKQGQNELLSLDAMYSLGENFFLNELSSQKGPTMDGGDADDISVEQAELREAIQQCFIEADVDKNMTLSRREFITLMKTHPIFEQLELKKKDIRRIMANADEDEDGNISYEEFLPLMLELFEGLKAQKVTSEEKEDAYDVAKSYVHGLSKDKLEGILRDMFVEADTDGSGTLDRKELKRCLQESRIGLTKKECQALLTEIDINNDGDISYEEFAPLAYEIILETVAEDVTGLTEDAAQIEEFLLDLFSGADANGTGEVKFPDLKQLLLGSDLGLSHIQIHSLLTIAPRKDKIVISKLATDLAPVLEKMLNYQWQREVYEQEAELRGQESTNVYGLDEDQFADRLKETFDKFAAGEGGAHTEDSALDAIDAFLVDLEGNDADFNALYALVMYNDDGTIDVSEVVEWGWETLFYAHNSRELGLF